MDELLDDVLAYIANAEGGACQERHGNGWPNCDDIEHADGRALAVRIEREKHPVRWLINEYPAIRPDESGSAIPPLSFLNVSTDEDIAANQVRFRITPG